MYNQIFGDLQYLKKYCFENVSINIKTTNELLNTNVELEISKVRNSLEIRDAMGKFNKKVFNYNLHILAKNNSNDLEYEEFLIYYMFKDKKLENSIYHLYSKNKEYMFVSNKNISYINKNNDCLFIERKKYSIEELIKIKENLIFI